MKASVFNWSGGKDSSLALYKILQAKEFEVRSLMTTLNTHTDRISMHGVRRELLEAQAISIGIPLKKIMLPESPSMEDYEKIMSGTMSELKNEGIETSIFGDIFLEDLRKYREDKLKEIGMTGHFPLWQRDTKEILNEFLDLGFKTVLVCVNSKLLPAEFAGRIIDKDFIKDLPKGVDPCGENGEYHSFVFDGPIFSKPIDFKLGDLVFKEYKEPKTEDGKEQNYGFYFRDLILK